MAIDILYIGNYRHPWCTEVHIAQELEALGHRVDRFQEPPNADSNTLTAIWRRGLEADLVLWTRTWGLPPQATEMWRRFEEAGIQTASYHLDLYLGLQREVSILSDPFWTTAHVFTPDGDHQDWFAKMAINHHYSPPAVVSTACYTGSPRDEYRCDIAFVGTPQPPYHREWPWRGQLIEHLRKRGARFFGGHFTGQPTREADLNDLYASAKVVVGDSLHLPGNTTYLSDRYFETMGRGGLLIAPWVPVLGQWGWDPMEMTWYEVGDLDEVDDQIDYWLGTSEFHREVRRTTNQELVKARHTYKHRLEAALLEMGIKS